MFQTRDAAFGTIKYASRSRAIVLENNDPLKKGRIIVDHPLLGETVWIPYLAVAGYFSVPEIGDIVYIECDAGFETHPVAWGNLNKGTDSLTDVPEEFQRVTPTNRGFYSPGGHLIEIDDGSDIANSDRGIRITTSEGSKITIADEPSDNSINIETSSGALINIDGLQDNIEITTSGGAHLTLDGVSDSIKAEINFGDSLELSASDGFQVDTPSAGGTHLSQKNGEVELTGFSSVTITDGSTGELKIASGKVALGSSAAELLDLMDQLIDQVDQTETGIEAITVPTAVGPSGPPINSATFIAIQVNLATIKSLLGTIKGTL